MARHPETILTKGYARTHTAPMPDIGRAAQNGPTTSIATFHGNAPYVSRQVFAILMEAPTAFSLLENNEAYVETLRALIEEDAQEITGLKSNLSYQWEEIDVGGAGEKLEVPADAKRDRSEPQHLYIEKYNMPITRFHDTWMRMLVMDPETKWAGIVSQDNVPLDLLPDRYTMTVLYFEPDPTMQFVNKAWLVANMAPRDNIGDVMQGRRNLTQPGVKSEINIGYTALTQVGYGVNMLAEKILNRMNKAGLNPHMHKAFLEDVSADVTSASGVGMDAAMTKRANNMIVP